MKFNKIKYLVVAFAGLLFASCETMPDAEIEYSPIWPLSGDWYVKVQLPNGTFARTVPNSDGETTDVFPFRTYNTAANTRDTMWVRLGSASYQFGLLSKTPCNVNDKTFSAQGVANSVVAGSTATILEGKVLLKAAKAPGTGYVADSIYMRYSLSNGNTYTVSGYRKTAFLEDEPHYE